MPYLNMPPWIQGYWTDTPTEYTSDDIFHLEPGGLSPVFLKQLALKSGNTPTPPIGSYLRTNTGGYFITNTGGKFKL